MAYLEELLPEFRKGAKICTEGASDDSYWVFKNGKIYNEKGIEISGNLSGWLEADDWSFYKEPEPDWDYIVKNKCLCWFWDEGEEEKRVAGILYGCDFQHGNVFYLTNNIYCDHCRPVRKDEVIFYVY